MPYGPQTAGAAEVSVRNLKCQVRAMHLRLDRLMGKHVPVNHPLIAWLVEHAAFVRLTGVVGTTRSEAPSTAYDYSSLGSEFGARVDQRKEVTQAKAPDGARECFSALIAARTST